MYDKLKVYGIILKQSKLNTIFMVLCINIHSLKGKFGEIRRGPATVLRSKFSLSTAGNEREGGNKR